MPQTPTAGHNAYVNFGFEASFGAGAVSARTFGEGPKITISRRNNMERIFGLGSRNAAAVAAKKYEGSASIEFTLSNASFFRAVFGAVADAGAGPYTHTYTEAIAPTSFAIDTAVELGTNDSVSELQGCVINTCVLNCTVGETVKVTLDCPYQTETLATSGIGSQVAETFAPFTFAMGSLQLPSGTTIGDVQTIELTLNNNLEMVWGLGSRFPTVPVGKTRMYDFRATVVFDDTTQLLTKMLGTTTAPDPDTVAETATLILTFTNGESSTAERSIVMTFDDITIDTSTLPQDVNEVIKEDVTGWARNITNVVWTNNTATDAGNP